MSREAAIAEIDAELEKLGIESDHVEEAQDEIEDTDDESEGEDDKQPEVVEQKPEEEVKEKPEIKLQVNDLPEGAGWYKAREEARKREELERQIEELKRPKVAKEENFEGFIESELGATKQDLADLKAWREQQDQAKQEEAAREAAFGELRSYENEAAGAFGDFTQASNYAKTTIATAIKINNPGISNEELAKRTVDKYAQYAAIALNQKKHPGQAIYEMAQEWGYKKAEEKPQITEVKDTRPTISRIGQNKQKSSGMSNSGGSGKAFMTNDALMSMTNQERMKLTESDWARLEAESA